MTDHQKDIAEVINNQCEAEEHAQLRCELHAKESDKRDKIWSKRYWFSMILVAVISGTLGGWKVYSTGPAFMGMVPKGYGEASYKELLKQSQKNDRQYIWFDRKRISGDAGFAQTDEKYPAQYEIWEGQKLIERWHWRVEYDKRTEQFGEYILRCVANYEHGKYVGFNQYQMSEYPSGDHFIMNDKFEGWLVDANSLTIRMNTSRGLFTMTGPDVKLTFKGNYFAYGEKIKGGFPYERGTVVPSDIIQNDNDLRYVEHVSTMFPFLVESVLEPYRAIAQLSNPPARHN